MLLQRNILHRHNFNHLVVRKPRPTPHLARSITTPRAFQQQPNNSSNNFSELKGAAEEAYNHACQILPDLEKAQHEASVAELPLHKAEAQWQQAFDILENIKHQANEAITTIRDGTIYSLGGIDTAESALLINHATTRLDQFKSHLDDQGHHDANPVTKWKLIDPPTDQKLTWIPGARMVTQLAACTISDVNHVVAVIAVSGPFLEQVLNGLVLHWGVVPHPSSGWAHPSPGWHTHPNISYPTGQVAMETVMAEYAPVMAGSRTVDMAHVFSVVVQLPLQGPVLDTDTAGIKFVLRRTDHQPPEWVKPHNNGDFYCDIAPVAKYFEQKEAAVEQRIAFQKAFEMPSAPRSFDEVDLSTLADGLEDWDWARALGSDDELEEKIAAIKGRPTADAIRASMEEEEREKVMMILEKEVAAVIAASAAATPPLPPPAWMKGVEGWTHVGDEEHVENIRHDGLERKLHHMRCILEMVNYHQHSHENQEEETSTSSEDSSPSPSREEMKQKVGELLEKCNNVESLLQKYDASELAAKVAQQEKECLQVILKEATNTASHLQHELTIALDTARKASVALRGRRTEVTLDDLETLCHQLAKQSVHESNNNGWWNTIVQNFNPENRTQVFYRQKEMEVAGMDAHVLVQVYMEGSMKEADEDEERGVDGAAANSEDENNATNIIKKKKEPSLAFDTVVMSIVAAEEFPDGRLTSPCNLHLGCVNHQYGQWSAPPSGWWASSAENSSGPRPATDNTTRSNSYGDDGKTSSSVALSSYKTYDKNGQPVFVNPVLYGTSLRMPLKGLVENKSRGVAFVLKTGGGGEVSPERWLSWQHGNGQTADFYVELPHADLI